MTKDDESTQLENRLNSDAIKKMSNVFSIRGIPPEIFMSIDEEIGMLAAQCRDGHCTAKRGLFVYQSHYGTVHHVAMGEPLSRIEAAGLLAWAIEQVKGEPE